MKNIKVAVLFDTNKSDPIEQLCVVGIKWDEGEKVKGIKGISDPFKHNDGNAKLKAMVQALERCVKGLES